MTSYVAYIRKDPNSAYGVEFPDLPGCTSVGATLEEAKAMAAEAIAGHVAVLQEMGEPVPAPSSLDQLADFPHRGDAILMLVDLDPGLLKGERVNVMLPKSLLGRIDAVSAGNRSRFLSEAAELKLAIPDATVIGRIRGGGALGLSSDEIAQLTSVTQRSA